MGGRILCLQNHNHQFFEIDVGNWEGVLYIYLRVHPTLSTWTLLLRLRPKPADLFALVSVYGEGILVSQVLMSLETSAATRRPPLHHYYLLRRVSSARLGHGNLPSIPLLISTVDHQDCYRSVRISVSDSRSLKMR